MNRDRALEQAKQGKRVTRKDWKDQQYLVTGTFIVRKAEDGSETFTEFKDIEKGADREAEDWEIVGAPEGAGRGIAASARASEAQANRGRSGMTTTRNLKE